LGELVSLIKLARNFSNPSVELVREMLKSGIKKEDV
jgi:hypothetical protein